MKKIFLTALAVSAAMSALAYDGEEIVDGICYRYYDATMTAEVVSNPNAPGGAYSGDVVIPSEVSSVQYAPAKYTVNQIATNAFIGAKMTSLTLPESLVTILRYAFDTCTVPELVIPNSVTSIGQNAFDGANINKITLGTSLLNIDGNAFKGCTTLTEVVSLNTTPPNISGNTFPAAVKSNIILKVPSASISTYKQALNWSGFKAYVPVGMEYIDGIWYSLNDTDGTAMVMSPYRLSLTRYSGDLTIPATVTFGGKNYTVTEIEAECFYQCALTALNLPETIVKIGWESIYELKLIENYVIPNSVKEIEYGVFYGNGMKTITLGSGLETIGDYAFEACSNLTDVYSLAEIPATIVAGTFPAAVKANTTLHVPFGKADTYKNAPNWSGFKEYVEMDPPTVPAEEIVLSQTEIVGEPNTMVQLTATVLPGETTDKTVTWTSSDESVATVSAEGLVTLVATGKAAITATCGEVTATCAVTVSAAVGIDGIEAETEAAEYFNMQGMRVASPEKGQIVIERRGDKTRKVRF